MATHKFGGPDTSRKLRCLQEYLQAFSIALRNQGFVCIYVDAFAGSGSRTETHPSLPLFGPEFAEPEEVTTPGSARLAVEIDPPLDEIVLIEKDPGRYSELLLLKDEFPHRKIVVRDGDANEQVQELCRSVKWRGPGVSGKGVRGVIFLDPYGMEVSWDTVTAIARTQALDCWYFFPLSGLYRNAPRRLPRLTTDKRAALNRIFGTHEWYERWYSSKDLQVDMFNDEATASRTADVNAIEQYVKERLESVFLGTVLDPVRLHHKNGAPLASLFFAVSNPSRPAVRLTTDIAVHILKRGRSSQVRSR